MIQSFRHFGVPFTKNKEMYVKFLHGKVHKGKKVERRCGLQWKSTVAGLRDDFGMMHSRG